MHATQRMRIESIKSFVVAATRNQSSSELMVCLPDIVPVFRVQDGVRVEHARVMERIHRIVRRSRASRNQNLLATVAIASSVARRVAANLEFGRQQSRAASLYAKQEENREVQ